MSVTITTGFSWASGNTVTPARLNTMLSGAVITMATARLLGRTTASPGAVEEITVGTGLSFTGGTLALDLPTALNPVSIGATTPGTGAFTTLSATGLISGTAQAVSNFNHASGTYSRWQVGGANRGIIGSANNVFGGSTDDFAICTENAGRVLIGSNNSAILEVSSPGLAVTGQTSTTSLFYNTGGSTVGNGFRLVQSSGDNLISLIRNDALAASGSALLSAYGSILFVAGATTTGTSGTLVGSFSPTGLAVTGTGSYTGTLSAASLTLTSALAVAQGGTGATSASAARTALGLAIGSDVQAFSSVLSTYAGINPSANVQTLLGSADFAACRSNLGLVIGTNVQAYDADLSALAALSGTNTIYYRSASNTWSAVTIGSNLTFSGGTLSASGGGGGSVTSVGVSGSSGIGVSGSPITGSGTITLSLGDITPTSVASTGTVTGTIADFTTSYKVAGTQVVGARGSAVASVALTGNYASDFSNIETAINNTLDRIRNHGLISP